MLLRDLDAKFLGERSDQGMKILDSVEGAQGVMFQCPLCAEGKERAPDGGFMGAHVVVIWFANPRGVEPSPYGDKGWQMTGTGLDDLTLSPSILLRGGDSCGWHGWVQNGDAK